MTAQTRHTITNSVGLLGITALLVAIILQLGAVPAPQITPGVSGGDYPVRYSQTGRSVNKFGATTNADNGVPTDVWDRANMADNQIIWLAPTAPRIHAIASSNPNDAGGVSNGARSIEVWGLPDWNTREVREVVVPTGTTPVNTANAYVIIHRMIVLSSGASGPNVGTITATAATDGTVTAQIQPGIGQTQMAIYGVPRGQVAYATQYYAGLLRASGNNNALSDVIVLASMDIENQPTIWIRKHITGASINGETTPDFRFDPFPRFPGPVVLKIQLDSSINNAQGYAGFDLILAEN